MLNQKIKVDFLEVSQNNIELKLAKVPITITYNVALAIYCNAVNRKFPSIDTAKQTTRHINQVSGRIGIQEDCN